MPARRCRGSTGCSRSASSPARTAGRSSTVNNIYGMLRAVMSGLGIAALPDFVASEHTRPGARPARGVRAAERGLFRLSRRTAHLEADQRVPRFPAAQGRRGPAAAEAMLLRAELTRKYCTALIALRFLQTSQDEFRLVIVRSNRHISGTRSVDRRKFSGSIVPNEFPGLVPGKRVFGSLRLLDVKPPCSNLAGTSVPANFFCPPATKSRSDFSVVREVLGAAEPGRIAGDPPGSPDVYPSDSRSTEGHE